MLAVGCKRCPPRVLQWLADKVSRPSVLPIRPLSTQRVLRQKSDPGLSGRPLPAQYRPSNFEKRLLVWAKKYPSVAEVPKYVPQNEMERTRNVVRIYVTGVMMVVTFMASIVMVYIGKQAAERGEGVTQMNLEWHRKMDEEAKAAEAK